MTETTAKASRSTFLPHPSLSLREILLVHLLVFQEAVLAFFIQDFIGPVRLVLNKCAYPVYQFLWMLESNVVCVNREKFDNEEKYRAFIMRFKCDTFCFIMQRFVRANLQSKEPHSFCLSITNQSQSCSSLLPLSTVLFSMRNRYFVL